MSIFSKASLIVDIRSNIYTNVQRLIKGNTLKARLLNIVDSTFIRVIDTSANFASLNPILANGEIGIESDTLTTTPKFKIGNGITHYNSLPYASVENQFIIDTSANFTSNNPILGLGQFGIESDNLVAVPKFKIGDGANDWNTLPYANEGSGSLNLDQVLTNGASTGGKSITSPDGVSKVKILDGQILLNIEEAGWGVIFPGLKIIDGRTLLQSYGSSGKFSKLDLNEGIATLKSDVSNNFDSLVHAFNNSVTKDGLELATENFVENLVAGLKFKLDVAAASTANVNIASAPSSIDGITLNIDERVLLKNQTSAPENGCYIFNGVGAPLTRATDSDTESKLISATYPVRGGIVNQDTWFTVTNDAITIGLTNIVISQTAGNGTYTVGSYLKLIGNVFDIDFTTFSTTQITEGLKLFFTDARARAAVITQLITSGVTDRSPSEDAIFNALALKSSLNSPTFTGDPKAPTPALTDNDTSISTTAFVQANSVGAKLFLYNNFF